MGEPLNTAQQQVARAMTEAQLLQAVIECAETLGWIVVHLRDSRRQKAEGLPDLLMVRPPQIIWAELKREPAGGRHTALKPLQAQWLDALQRCHQEAYLWRPGDWLNGEIEKMLR